MYQFKVQSILLTEEMIYLFKIQLTMLINQDNILIYSHKKVYRKLLCIMIDQYNKLLKEINGMDKILLTWNQYQYKNNNIILNSIKINKHSNKSIKMIKHY